MFVIVTTDQQGFVSTIGPFDTENEAQRYANGNCYGVDCTVTELNSPIQTDKYRITFKYDADIDPETFYLREDGLGTIEKTDSMYFDTFELASANAYRVWVCTDQTGDSPTRRINVSIVKD